MNNSSIVTTTFCRKCYKLRSCLYTKSMSNYSFLCKQCAKNEDLVIECIECGREATKDILKYSGYCHLCYRDNLSECSLCGTETYKNKLIDGICNKCINGTNKPCSKCGDYVSKDKLTRANPIIVESIIKVEIDNFNLKYFFNIKLITSNPPVLPPSL